MKLERTAAILDIVEAAATDGTLVGPTQSFLAQYLAVVLYSEMEERVADIVKAHLEKYTHEAVATFVSTTMADVIRRLPKSDIAKLAARFGDNFKIQFNSATQEHKVAIYGNVISARHEIGHRRGSNITIAEVRAGHDAANHILEVLSTCLTAMDNRQSVSAI